MNPGDNRLRSLLIEKEGVLFTALYIRGLIVLRYVQGFGAHDADSRKMPKLVLAKNYRQCLYTSPQLAGENSRNECGLSVTVITLLKLDLNSSCPNMLSTISNETEFSQTTEMDPG